MKRLLGHRFVVMAELMAIAAGAGAAAADVKSGRYDVVVDDATSRGVVASSTTTARIWKAHRDYHSPLMRLAAWSRFI